MIYHDPMERLIAEALQEIGEPFEFENAKSERLDFLIPKRQVFIEVKQFHSNRIARQMGRVDNIIAAQGKLAVQLLADLIKGKNI